MYYRNDSFGNVMLNKTQPCHMQLFLQTHQEDTNFSFRALECCYFHCDDTEYTPVTTVISGQHH